MIAIEKIIKFEAFNNVNCLTTTINDSAGNITFMNETAQQHQIRDWLKKKSSCDLFETN